MVFSLELTVPDSLVAMDIRAWPFYHFPVLLPVSVGKADDGALLTLLNAYSPDAAVIPHTTLPKQTTQSRRTRTKWILLR